MGAAEFEQWEQGKRAAMRFPQKLRKLRERRGISRRVLSELCGLSKNMISVYELGESEPTASTLVILAETFGVSVDELLGR